MAKSKKIEITIAATELIVIRQTGSNVRWCVACGVVARMVTPENVAAISGLSARAIYRQIESTQIHFIETADGRLWVCTNSLAP